MLTCFCICCIRSFIGRSNEFANIHCAVEGRRATRDEVVFAYLALWAFASRGSKKGRQLPLALQIHGLWCTYRFDSGWNDGMDMDLEMSDESNTLTSPSGRLIAVGNSRQVSSCTGQGIERKEGAMGDELPVFTSSFSLNTNLTQSAKLTKLKHPSIQQAFSKHQRLIID